MIDRTKVLNAVAASTASRRVDVEDAVQEAYAIRYAREREFANEEHETAWLIVVARRALWGQKHPLLLADPDAPAAEPVAVSDPAIEFVEVLELLRELNPNYARTLLLVWAGFSYEEIAADEGRTYTNVNKALVKGRRKLALALAA